MSLLLDWWNWRCSISRGEWTCFCFPFYRLRFVGEWWEYSFDGVIGRCSLVFGTWLLDVCILMLHILSIHRCKTGTFQIDWESYFQYIIPICVFWYLLMVRIIMKPALMLVLHWFLVRFLCIYFRMYLAVQDIPYLSLYFWLSFRVYWCQNTY